MPESPFVEEAVTAISQASRYAENENALREALWGPPGGGEEQSVSVIQLLMARVNSFAIRGALMMSGRVVLCKRGPLFSGLPLWEMLAKQVSRRFSLLSRCCVYINPSYTIMSVGFSSYHPVGCVYISIYYHVTDRCPHTASTTHTQPHYHTQIQYHTPRTYRTRPKCVSG